MEDKKLKTGYTTGTCAAAAAKAAAVFLLTGRRIEEVEVELPEGGFCRQRLEVTKADILEQKSCGWKDQRQVSGWFGVKKDAGDDPDVTHGTVIYAQAERLEEKERPEKCYELEEFPGVYLTGGPGVGVATRPGLSCPPDIMPLIRGPEE